MGQASCSEVFKAEARVPTNPIKEAVPALQSELKGDPIQSDECNLTVFDRHSIYCSFFLRGGFRTKNPNVSASEPFESAFHLPRGQMLVWSCQTRFLILNLQPRQGGTLGGRDPAFAG